MDRDLFRSLPASAGEELRLLACLAALPPAERDVTAVRPDGTTRRLRVQLSLSVEEPFAGEAAVVASLRFAGESPAEDEALAENLWEVVAGFLAEREAEARATADEGR